jgi:hypothetical protein
VLMIKELREQFPGCKCFRIRRSEGGSQVQIIKELRKEDPGTADSKGVSSNWRRSPTWIDGHERVSFTGPPPVTKAYSNRRSIKDQGNFGGADGKGSWRLQCQENKNVTDAIRELDKATLNLYTSTRAELGSKEVSWICFGLSRLRAWRRVQEFMEDRQS